MAWNNQNGGGGWKSGGGGGGGPWGQGPQGGGGSGQQPDLEELLKRSQDKLKQALPGGGGSGLIWLVAIIGLLLVWGSQSFFTVQPDEEAVVLRFGKAVPDTKGPGFHFILWPIEKVEKVKISQENLLNFGSATSGGTSEMLVLSRDQNVVDMNFSVSWKIADSKKFLFNVKDPENLIYVVAESAMRDIVSRNGAEEIRITKRKEIGPELQKNLQALLDQRDAGILIREVNVKRADPPPQVMNAFRQVQSAEQDRNKSILEGERTKNEKLGEARGEASRIVEEARGYKAKVTTEALGEAQRFLAVYEEYSKAKDVTRKRLFLETLEKVLSQSNKVVIEQGAGGPGVIPYLPLPEVQKRLQSNQNTQGGQ